jgi:hypothetical protein
LVSRKTRLGKTLKRRETPSIGWSCVGIASNEAIYSASLSTTVWVTRKTSRRTLNGTENSRRPRRRDSFESKNLPRFADEDGVSNHGHSFLFRRLSLRSLRGLMPSNRLQASTSYLYSMLVSQPLHWTQMLLGSRQLYAIAPALKSK